MRKVYDFLRDLQSNNSKQWMHANKSYYEEAKQVWADELAVIYERLSKYDDRLNDVTPKKTMMRINNNLMYHPDKPIYKDYFASSPFSNKYSGIYIHISPNGNFVAGGLHNPKPKTLKKIRKAIDENGKELENAISKKSFTDFFGGLQENENKLKTSPKGYDSEHKYIELLRRKDFIALKSVTQKEVISGDYMDTIETAFKELKPINDFFRKVI